MRLLRIAARALRQPPRVVARRLAYEVAAQAERWVAPWRARRFGARRLAAACGASSLDTLWVQLAQAPYPVHTEAVAPAVFDSLCPGERRRILAAAEDALGRRVRLLGSETVTLGTPIDWSRDFKSGRRWAPRYMRDIDYVDPHDASDVKIPWELSRLQWLMPAGQAYLLTGDERYAAAVRGVLEEWISENPYAQSVNWSCTMEAALRIFSWTWFFRVFHASRSWADPAFRERFLCALYLHGDFTDRHVEISDVNGNHCTADAAALAWAGLFFRGSADARRWHERGLSILTQELPRQVTPDGVDFEASTAYHRLVTELFLLPALYHRALGLALPDSYRERLVAMARFSAAYSREDGSSPLWGDADDARSLPFGGQPLDDHRYLAALVGIAWDVPGLRSASPASMSEVFWTFGPSLAEEWLRTASAAPPHRSMAFPEGGFFVMRNGSDHVFVDCGPVGLAGRGGHGHNDCLSFEAALDGVRLVSDCGAYAYTGSFEERNRFRSTAAHNTPRVDGEEINRIDPDLLWHLRDDARPELRRFEAGENEDVLCGSHTGYQRLTSPVTPVRTIRLDHARHRLTVADVFEGWGLHAIEIPLHLAPGVTADAGDGQLTLQAAGRAFRVSWDPAEAWTLAVEAARVSPSYGVAVPTTRLCWRRSGNLEPGLTVTIEPEGRA